MDVAALELLRALEEAQLDDERDAHDLAPELLGEVADRPVPPVARTSAWTSTRCPLVIASAWSSSEFSPYSSAYVALTVFQGSFPGLLAAMKPHPSL